jgi:CBS domain-containing protein
VVNDPLPIGLFGRLLVERQDPGGRTVDLKMGGTRQLVGAARVYALALGIGETNTVDRLRAAAGAGFHAEAEVRDIVGAYQHLLRLRLVHQLDQLDRGEPPDNRVRVDELSRADGLLLRDALRVVADVKRSLKDRYGTDLIG